MRAHDADDLVHRLAATAKIYLSPNTDDLVQNFSMSPGLMS